MPQWIGNKQMKEKILFFGIHFPHFGNLKLFCIIQEFFCLPTFNTFEDFICKKSKCTIKHKIKEYWLKRILLFSIYLYFSIIISCL